MTAGRVPAVKAASCQGSLRRRGRRHLRVFSPSAERRLNHESLNHSLFCQTAFSILFVQGAARAPSPIPRATGSRLQGFGFNGLICPNISLGLQLLVEATPWLGYEEIIERNYQQLEKLKKKLTHMSSILLTNSHLQTA